MLIFPAIDIKDGCVVRLLQGRSDKKVYSKDPTQTARHWRRQGARFIHVIDLDGAARGLPQNLDCLGEIINIPGLSVQFGGGVRTIETIQILLKLGVWRVILGTKAAEDSTFLKKVFQKFKERIIVSIDTQDEQVFIKGWQKPHPPSNLFTFAHSLKKIGFQEFIYTDISKDGTLRGPNIKGIKKLLKDTGLGIIASGGISSLEDLRRLKLLKQHGLTGVILGKSLYEARFTFREALKFS